MRSLGMYEKTRLDYTMTVATQATSVRIQGNLKRNQETLIDRSSEWKK
jgi:hypothetical protein